MSDTELCEGRISWRNGQYATILQYSASGQTLVAVRIGNDHQRSYALDALEHNQPQWVDPHGYIQFRVLTPRNPSGLVVIEPVRWVTSSDGHMEAVGMFDRSPSLLGTGFIGIFVVLLLFLALGYRSKRYRQYDADGRPRGVVRQALGVERPTVWGWVVGVPRLWLGYLPGDLRPVGEQPAKKKEEKPGDHKPA